MSSRWIFVFFIWLLLVAQSLMDSGDASGDLDDSDIPNASKLGQRNKTSLVTKNASDFHYVARDDHEIIHNQEREMKRQSRRLRAKTKYCWRRCLRTLECFEQMNNRPKSKKGRCGVCIAKCSTLPSAQPLTRGVNSSLSLSAHVLYQKM
ncbi:Hypothetical predicted protein [Paramuricea clavata]|uniref:Uncharacterized protein n=1 Tax=Paramuricea clavata TaxID=317549 RepID=A0A6S7FFB5_PARCT|nr:Hypothetical predicted protein [Paramuricea clavata]